MFYVYRSDPILRARIFCSESTIEQHSPVYTDHQPCALQPGVEEWDRIETRIPLKILDQYPQVLVPTRRPKKSNSFKEEKVWCYKVPVRLVLVVKGIAVRIVWQRGMPHFDFDDHGMWMTPRSFPSAEFDKLLHRS